MKKVLAVILALVMIFSFTACGKKESDRLADIKERGYIEVATEPYFAPFEFLDPNKEGDEAIVGFDIEIAKYIADKIGVELKLVPLDFTAVLAGVTDGKYDLAISAIAYSAERTEAMALSDGYNFDDEGYGFIVRTEDVDKYNSIEAAKDAVIITQSGSVQEGMYNEFIGECKEFKLVANMTDGYLAVAEGKADICVCSTDSASLYAEANGGLAIPEFRFEVSEESSGTRVAAPLEGTDALMEVVNEAIAELRESGQIDAWKEEYAAYAAELGIE